VVSDDAEPWERLPEETSRAYVSFREFRDLGPTRTLRAVSAKLGTARGWSLRYRWTERARAWDAETHRLEDARRLDSIRQMDDQHQQIARLMIAAGIRALQGEDVELTPHQAARLLDLGTRLQRAALTGEHLPPAAAPLADVEDLSPLERIARELAGIA
jgi:hypothetical protein